MIQLNNNNNHGTKRNHELINNIITEFNFYTYTAASTTELRVRNIYNLISHYKIINFR